jgi:hypothetical protein
MIKKKVLSSVLLLPISAAIVVNPSAIEVVYAQTTTGIQNTNYSYGGTPINASPVTPTNPVVYGGGAGSSNPLGITLTSQQQQLLSTGIGALSSLLNGGGLSGVTSSLGGLVSQIPGLSSSTQGIISSSLPALTSLLNGGGISGVLSSVPGILSNIPGISSQTQSIVGAALPVLQSLFSGNFSIGGLVSAIGGLLGLGGGSSSITFSTILQSLLNSGTTAAITNAVFGSSGSNSQANVNGVLALTGDPLCAYNSTCVTSNPVPYRDVYATSAGAMGFSNPNEARGKIWEKSRQGVRSDVFAEGVTQNAVYVGHHTDNKIARASTDRFLSKAGQEASKKAIDAAEQVGMTAAQLADKTAKDAKATQDLARGILQVTGPVPSLLAKQVELGYSVRDNGEFNKVLLGNISSSVDATRRMKDVDNTAIANAMLSTSSYNPKLRR